MLILSMQHTSTAVILDMSQGIAKKAEEAGQEAAQKELADMMVKAKEMADKEEAEAAAAALKPDVSHG